MIDCAAMAAEVQSQEELQRMHFMKQLAACVRRIQWTYAIFWSKSSRYEGSLEWNDGYYNGDIKTRKTTEQSECKADHMGLQRSEQLRELYESLCTGDSNQQNRPHALLSPEDLTDAEWYYLICMSFTFNFGQDLPGKAYELNEPIWLNNAQLAENTSFCRSLLAKSASIQTVVCFPFMDGVLELGTSERKAFEEPSFVHNITSSFWEFQAPGFSEHSASSSLLEGKVEDNVCLISDLDVHDNMMLENHALITENDSHVFKDIIVVPEEGANFRDDPLSISFAHNIILSPPKGEPEKSCMFDYLEADHHSQLGSLGIEEDGAHYASTLSTILENLKKGTLAAGFPFQNGSNVSSFKIWEKGSKASKIFIKSPQRMLKNVLCDMNWMNEGQSAKPHEEDVPRNKAFKLEADDANSNHVLSERRRREKLNEKFLTLRSLVPSISKVDKASILSDTIEYLKELEKRVEELEFCREERDPAMRERRKHPDTAERTSDNYGDDELISCRKPSTNKRKACEIEDSEVEIDINVTMIEKEVLVELHCPCRDFLLVDIIEALSSLRLDAHSVRSSTVDSTAAIALRAKFISTNIASPGMIKRSLHRVIAKGQINL